MVGTQRQFAVNGLVENNTIMGGYRGIVAQFNEKILSNTIEGATVGISCGYMSSDPLYHPTIIGNVLTNNYVGIDDYGCDPYVANNSITANKFGFYFTSYTFYGNAIPDGIIKQQHRQQQLQHINWVYRLPKNN